MNPRTTSTTCLRKFAICEAVRDDKFPRLHLKLTFSAARKKVGSQQRVTTGTSHLSSHTLGQFEQVELP